MTDKEYVCGYPKCLHHGEKVLGSEAVMIGKKRYHWDCAALKQEIKDCIDTYMEYIEDKTQFPAANKIISSMVFKSKVPIEFIKQKIVASKKFYSNKPVFVLYGIKKLYWEKEVKLTVK